MKNRRGWNLKLQSGSRHYLWTGEKATYETKHHWINSKHGKAFKCEQIQCDGTSKRYDWANISGKYTRDIKDYKMMCRKCHMNMDWSKYCRNGHERTEENTYLYKGVSRRCRICALANQRKRRAMGIR